VAFRQKLYTTIEELQADLDAWPQEYNERRPHQDRWCYGKTPMYKSPSARAGHLSSSCSLAPRAASRDRIVAQGFELLVLFGDSLQSI
jgi:hypothetical protein